jgi:lipopolysaccharide export system protein LptA
MNQLLTLIYITISNPFKSVHSPVRLIWLLLALQPFAISGFAQQKKTRINLEGADSLYYNEKRLGQGVQAVIGNVKFSHQNTIMFCDSAYNYRDSNKVVAFSNVHMIINDSIHLHGDKLEYLGNQNLAKVRDNVKLIKGDVILTTQNLDYDRNKDVGYYFDKGIIVNGENTLYSELGFYYTNANEVFFKDSVKVINPKYTMFSDTLKYFTITKIVKILGPTFITSDENLIYSEDGFYNTENNKATLIKNSYIQGKEQTLKGDTIFYDRNLKFGEVFSKMELIDTTNHVILKGNYGYYNDSTKKALATKRATLLQIEKGDTLYLHADTLRLDPIDGLEGKLIRAYRHVKFFRHDLQGRCDSMVYHSIDSTNTFYNDPVIWAQGTQMMAETITMYNKSNILDRVELVNSALVVQQEDTTLFNQIKGKKMVGYISQNQLTRIEVDGNGQTVFYPKDKDIVIGVNRAESSNLTIYFKDQKASKIVMRVQPTGNINPPFLLPPNEVKLSGFVWLEDYRPKQIEDIYIQDQLPKMEARPTFSDYHIDNAGLKSTLPKKPQK